MKCKIFTIFLFLVASFWFGSHAKASDILDHQQNTTSNYLYYPQFKVWGQQFTADQNNISYIYVYYHTGTSTISICSGVPADTNTPDLEANGVDCNWPGNSLLRKETLSDAGHAGGYALSSPVGTTVGNNYYFIFSGNTNSAQAGYCASGCGGGLVVGGEPQATTLAFHTYYSTTYNPPATFQLNLLTPSPTAPFTTYYGQPASYTFTYENPLNWYPQIRFMVKRKADARASAWPNYINSSTFWTSSVATSTLTFATSTFQLPDGYYDLDVYFWANIPTSPVHATSTFTINTGGTYGGYSFATSTLLTPPTFSTADICGDIATTTTFGAIECGLMKAFIGTITWAFAPSFDTLTNFRVSFELFKGCFPFNTYFQLTDTITSVVSSTATSTAGTVKIPFIHTITGGGTFYMLDAVSSSTLSNWIGVSNYNLFRTTIGYFFWLIAVAVVFFTVKYI